MNTDFVLEPVRFFGRKQLFSGAKPELLPAGSAIIRDLAEAMTLENDQDPPPGYRIWHDVVEQTLAEFWSTPEAREGRNLVDAAADEQWNAMEDFERELRKKRIRKTITAKEEFWLTVAYDSLEILKGIAVGRYVCGGVPLLEGIFSVYKAGFYPCGVAHEMRLAVFDPTTLGADAV
ncbi:hypothetical protein [Paracoccus aminovorans]|uniref:hypothetical protein n=1 Tax=Paracoccus aminovorans TaxID=34004 RepID=UPI0007857416|nr:hypothetical protein [Paracoccus aminovorans]